MKLRVIREENLAERSLELGEYFMEQLAEIPSPHVKEVRGKGLLIGVELNPEANGARRLIHAARVLQRSDIATASDAFNGVGN